jgi:hypothetical protein
MSAMGLNNGHSSICLRCRFVPQADSSIAANIRQGISQGQFRVLGLRKSHCAGTSAGAPLSLIKSTRNFAGWVPLAFRSTT